MVLMRLWYFILVITVCHIVNPTRGGKWPEFVFDWAKAAANDEHLIGAHECWSPYGDYNMKEHGPRVHDVDIIGCQEACANTPDCTGIDWQPKALTMDGMCLLVLAGNEKRGHDKHTAHYNYTCQGKLICWSAIRGNYNIKGSTRLPNVHFLECKKFCEDTPACSGIDWKPKTNLQVGDCWWTAIGDNVRGSEKTAAHYNYTCRGIENVEKEQSEKAVEGKAGEEKERPGEGGFGSEDEETGGGGFRETIVGMLTSPFGVVGLLVMLIVCSGGGYLIYQQYTFVQDKKSDDKDEENTPLVENTE